MKTKTLRNLTYNPISEHERKLMANYLVYSIIRPLGMTVLNIEETKKVITEFGKRFNLGYCDSERVVKGIEFSDSRFSFDTGCGLYNITLTLQEW